MYTTIVTKKALTEREMQLLWLLTDGKLNKEIAVELLISLDTVKKHLKNIYRKINARNRIEAVNYAIRLKSQDPNQINLS